MALLLNLFREKMQASKDDMMKIEKVPDVGYPTLFLSFDFANGCIVKVTPKDGRDPYQYYSLGVVDGSMVAAFGRSGCGKSTFLMQVAGAIKKQFPMCEIHHEDAEGGLEDTRKMMLMGIISEEEFKDGYICRNTGITTENFFARFSELYDLKMAHQKELMYDTGKEDAFGNPIYKLQPTIYFLDSLMMLYPEKYAEDAKEKNSVAGQMAAPGNARMNTQIVRRMIPRLKMANIIFFMINHVLKDTSLTPTKPQNAWMKVGERLPGGETCVFLANNILRFDDGEKLSREEKYGIDGQIVRLQICKSRTNKPGVVIPMVLDYDRGFDNDLSLLELLKEKGMVSTGSWCYLKSEPSMKFQQKGFKKKLREDRDFARAFQQDCIIVLDQLINPPQYDDASDEMSMADMILGNIRTTKNDVKSIA